MQKKTVKSAVSFGTFGTYERKLQVKRWWNWHMVSAIVFYLMINHLELAGDAAIANLFYVSCFKLLPEFRITLQNLNDLL